MLFSNATIANLIATTIALLLAFTVHEATHAFIAYSLGDMTAKRMGRLSLNPLAHLDPLGTLLILVSGFGWGKPVPVNPNNLRPGGKAGMGIVGAAGPLSNLLLAYIFATPLRFGWVSFTYQSFSNPLIPSIPQILLAIVSLNIFLAVFNLLPIPPLDGYNVLMGLLPPKWAYKLSSIERFGPIILLFLLLFGRLGGVDILGLTLGKLANIILTLVLI